MKTIEDVIDRLMAVEHPDDLAEVEQTCRMNLPQGVTWEQVIQRLRARAERLAERRRQRT